MLEKDTSKLGSGLLTMGKGCPGAPEFRPENEKEPLDEFAAEKNRLTSLINFVKGKGILDSIGEPLTDDDKKEKAKLARARFCDLRQGGTDGADDNFDTFVNVCLFSLKSVSAWRTDAYQQTPSESFSVSDEAFAMLVLENNIDDFDQLLHDLNLTEEEIARRGRGPVALRDRKASKCRYTKGTQVESILIRNKRVQVSDAKRRKLLVDSEDSSKYQGWTAEGIARYNELYNAVKRNRDTEKGKLADDRVWKRYMALCCSDGDVAVVETNSVVVEDSEETVYENGYDDFAVVML